MNFRSKLRSAWNKLTGKSVGEKRRSDSELGADEVVQEEVFPKKSAKPRNACSNKKPPSKRTRPVNNNYRMIDIDDDTFDASKS